MPKKFFIDKMISCVWWYQTWPFGNRFLMQAPLDVDGCFSPEEAAQVNPEDLTVLERGLIESRLGK